MGYDGQAVLGAVYQLADQVRARAALVLGGSAGNVHLWGRSGHRCLPLSSMEEHSPRLAVGL